MPYQTFNQILSSDSINPVQKLTYKNNTKRTLYFNKFDLLPDAQFIKYGSMHVTKNGIQLFSSDRDDKPLKKYSQFPIRDKLFFLQRDEEFEIFVNSTNADYKVELGISIELEHENIPISSVLIPYVTTPQDIGSEVEILFERLTRSAENSPYYKILDMKGFRNLIVLIGAATVVLPARLYLPVWGLTEFPVSVSGGTSVIGAIGFDFFNDTTSKLMHIDIDSNATHYDGIGVENHRNYFDVILDVSNDPNFLDNTTELSVTTLQEVELRHITNGDGSVGQIPKPQNIDYATTKRYARLRGTILNVVGTQTSNTLNASAVDTALSGGSAQLSFEIKDLDNEWYDHIPASEINAVTYGEKVKIELGEAITGHVLPTVPNSFRAKLVIIGAIKTGITATRIV